MDENNVGLIINIYLIPWMQYLMAWGNFFIFGTSINFLGPRSRSQWPHKAPFLPCEGDTSVTLWRNHLTFGTNIHLDSRINSVDFGQRSKSRWPHKACLFSSWMWHLEISLRECLGTNVHWGSIPLHPFSLLVGIEGQSSTALETEIFQTHTSNQGLLKLPRMTHKSPA